MENDPVKWNGPTQERSEREGGMGHVLIVEDELPLRRAIAAFVSAEGWTVEEAGDGEEAVAAVARSRPDVVLLDLVLPRMDGYEFMGELARRYGRGRPPVIVLSAAERLDLARARLGAEAYIAKPFDPDRLRAALARLSLPRLRR